MPRLSPLNVFPPFRVLRLANDREPTLEAAVRVRIKDRVTGLAEVYLTVTGPRPTLPFAIVSPLRYSMPITTNAREYWEQTPLQVTIFSANDIEANTLGRLAMKAMKNQPALKFDDGYHMGGWSAGTRKSPEPEIGPGGVKAFRFEFDWMFLVGREESA